MRSGRRDREGGARGRRVRRCFRCLRTLGCGREVLQLPRVLTSNGGLCGSERPTIVIFSADVFVGESRGRFIGCHIASLASPPCQNGKRLLAVESTESLSRAEHNRAPYEVWYPTLMVKRVKSTVHYPIQWFMSCSRPEDDTIRIKNRHCRPYQGCSC
jgi:hypothetical protein